MSNSLTVTFPYSAAEHANARAESPERRDMFRWWWRPLNLAVAAIIIGRAAISSNTLMGTVVAALLASPFFAALIFMPELVKRLDVARFQRDSVHRKDTVETRTFGPDGFTCGGWSEPIPWPLITRVVESEQFFFVYHAVSHMPEYVPKVAMSESDTQRLRCLLKDELRSLPAALQLFPGAT